MRLHVRECPECHRLAIRLDNETKWCGWTRGGYVKDIKAQHDVLSHEAVNCGSMSCSLATTAGVGTVGLAANDYDSGL